MGSTGETDMIESALFNDINQCDRVYDMISNGSYENLPQLMLRAVLNEETRRIIRVHTQVSPIISTDQFKNTLKWNEFESNFNKGILREDVVVVDMRKTKRTNWVGDSDNKKHRTSSSDLGDSESKIISSIINFHTCGRIGIVDGSVKFLSDKVYEYRKMNYNYKEIVIYVVF